MAKRHSKHHRDSTVERLNIDSDLGDPKVFVLERELAEVHLLLENLSTNPDKRLSIRPEKRDQLPKDWIEQICLMNWPPQGDRATLARQAALLIRAKDFLNRQAKPASGATIAFTVLLTQRPSDSEPPSETSSGSDAQPPSGTNTNHSRRSLAEQAYPELIGPAQFLTWFRNGLHWFVLCCLVITCLISWYAAYGAATLSQQSVAESTFDAALKRLNDAEANANPPLLGSGASVDPTPPETPGQGQALRPVPSTIYAVRLCQRSELLPELRNPPGPPVAKFYSVPDIQVCDAAYTAKYNLNVIDGILNAWLLRDLFSHAALGSTTSLNSLGNHDVTAEVLAAARLNVIGGGILPVFYGLLGAGAAVVRGMSRKFKESRLSPRDVTLSLQQLALGAVMGSCISLFVAQPSTSASEATAGLISAVALSSSALSFVAGFAVEQVFNTLESLIRRIFPEDQPTTHPPQQKGQ